LAHNKPLICSRDEDKTMYFVHLRWFKTFDYGGESWPCIFSHTVCIWFYRHRWTLLTPERWRCRFTTGFSRRRFRPISTPWTKLVRCISYIRYFRLFTSSPANSILLFRTDGCCSKQRMITSFICRVIKLWMKVW